MFDRLFVQGAAVAAAAVQSARVRTGVVEKRRLVAKARGVDAAEALARVATRVLMIEGRVRLRHSVYFSLASRIHERIFANTISETVSKDVK